jgi:pimeloyl-ACP methyl ester carboxylesterase
MNAIVSPILAALSSLALVLSACGSTGGERSATDGPSEAGPDAEVPDAEVPDAEVADAEVPDAEVPDSSEPPCASHWGGEGNPDCTTCGCDDPSWSCAISTCMSPAGTVRELGEEAGFFTLDAYEFKGKDPNGEGRMVPTRIFYAFQPADEDAPDKPLFVFLNGGPGCATTSMLFSFNTSKRTLDTPEGTEPPWVDNPHSFTRLGNVLYVDSRNAGFSYNFAGSAGQLEEAPHSGVDAADVLRVVLRFLDRHEPLRDNSVVLVGESWGGARANVMADLARSPEALRAPASNYVDTGLADELDLHVASAFPGSEGTDSAEHLLARQFGAQALIQPFVLAMLQQAAQHSMEEPEGIDPEEESSRVARVEEGVRNYEVLRAMLGVDPAEIRDLMPENRVDVQRSYCDAEPNDTGTLPDVFGSLSQPEDCYYQACVPTGIDFVQDASAAYAFLRNLGRVDMLITNATLDTTVRSPAIVEALRTQPQWFSTVKVVSPEDPRNARIHLETTEESQDLLGYPPSIEIPFPSYASGHCVPMYQPEAFFSDIEAWLK